MQRDIRKKQKGKLVWSKQRELLMVYIKLTDDNISATTSTDYL